MRNIKQLQEQAELEARRAAEFRERVAASRARELEGARARQAQLRREAASDEG